MKTVIIIRQKTWVAQSVVGALKSIGYFIDDILISDKWEPSFKQVLSRDTIVIVDDSDIGVKICKKLRNYIFVPIIVISTRNGLIRKTTMLNQGADDVIPLSVSFAELAARLDTIIRRYEHRVKPYCSLTTLI